MSKVLIFSDLHLHNWPYGSTVENGRNSRLQVQADFLDYIANFVSNMEIDMVVFCGDLVHTHGRLDIDVLNVAISGLKKIANRTHCYALIGNHDIKNANLDLGELFVATGWTPVARNNGVNAVTYANKKKKIASMGFVSYMEDKKAMKEILTNGPTPDFMFLHNGVQGVPVGSGFEIPDETINPEDMRKNKTLTFTGHYHRHQKVNDNLVVVGSPMQHTWGDSGDERGFILLDTDSGRWKFKPYDYAPKFVEVKAGTETKEIVNNNYIRVILKKTMDDLDNYRKDLYKLGAKSVEFRVLTRDKPIQNFNVASTDILQDVISKYEEESKASKETIEIGRQIRQGTYDPSKHKH